MTITTPCQNQDAAAADNDQAFKASSTDLTTEIESARDSAIANFIAAGNNNGKFSSTINGITAVPLQQQQQQDSDDHVDEAWKKSPFAVGPTKQTWAEEEVDCRTAWAACCCGSGDGDPNQQVKTSMYCTAFLCARLGAGRVGNMVVLWQSTTRTKGPNGEWTTKPKLRLVIGPFWMVPILVTFPLIALFTAFTYFRGNVDENKGVFIAWCLCTGILVLSLCKVSTSDPGILHRYTTSPVNEGGGNTTTSTTTAEEEEEWVWNDQAHTFRPAHARFDSEAQAVVTHYDHLCPWTGTVIGGGNIFWFWSFVCFTVITMFLDIVLITVLS